MPNRRWTIAGAVLLLAILTLAIGASEKPGNAAVSTGLAIGVAALMRRSFKQLGDRLTDLSEERRNLEAAQSQCVAATGVNNARRDRLARREAEIEREAAAWQAETEARIRKEFEQVRAQDLCSAYFLGAMNERDGKHVNGGAEAAMAQLIDLNSRRRTVPTQDTVRGTGTVTPAMNPASSER